MWIPAPAALTGEPTGEVMDHRSREGEQGMHGWRVPTWTRLTRFSQVAITNRSLDAVPTWQPTGPALLAKSSGSTKARTRTGCRETTLRPFRGQGRAPGRRPSRTDLMVGATEPERRTPLKPESR